MTTFHIPSTWPRLILKGHAGGARSWALQPYEGRRNTAWCSEDRCYFEGEDNRGGSSWEVVQQIAMSLDFVREVADDLREMFRQGPMREHAPRVGHEKTCASSTCPSGHR
jgi:hypothetical protein